VPRPIKIASVLAAASPQGKTAGRGTKGQKARTGKKIRATFMGGQNPLSRQVPRRGGFKSLHVPAQVVYTGQLAAFDSKTADNASLASAGLIATPYHMVKVIVKGELEAKVTLKVQGASKGAVAAIQKAGGTFEKTDTPIKPSTKPHEEQA
jgi:large subunit ribosomal protein L15